jgi:hypothetical protein
LTKQLKEEQKKLRGESSSNSEAEVTTFQEAMHKLRKDTAIEILSVSHSMRSVCEKLGERLTSRIEETDK